MAPDRRIGTELGGYRIVELLGRGAIGVVYRAEHIHLGRPAALKLFAPVFDQEEFRDRFLRESKLVASLDHPNIVPVYDAGEEDGQLYLAMACIEGDDLKALLARESRLSLRRSLSILAQIASALDSAHERGLIHRDVKPANILVSEDGRAYLSDFGVAKELSSAGSTRTGSFIGTIEYCSPEQIEGKQVDARTDVYALACVFFECLTGASPFHHSSDVAVLNAHLHAPPPKLTRAVPELPVTLEQVVSKALSKSPLDRYSSCGEFLSAVHAAIKARHVHRRRLAVSIALLALAALLGAVVALLARSALVGDSSGSNKPAAGQLDKVLLRSNDGETLNNIAFALIGEHEYARALPFARRAMQKAQPRSAIRTYAVFNTGRTLLELDRCRESLPFLRKALTLEPDNLRGYVQSAIKQAESC